MSDALVLSALPTLASASPIRSGGSNTSLCISYTPHPEGSKSSTTIPSPSHPMLDDPSGTLFKDPFTENLPWLLRLSVTFITDSPFSLLLFLPQNTHLSLQLPISHLTAGLTSLITTVSQPLFTLPNKQKEVLNKYQLNESMNELRYRA